MDTAFFPWARHLTDRNRLEFAADLAEAFTDFAASGSDHVLRATVISWRATARIMADPEQYRDALRLIWGDFGPVEIV